MMNNFHDRYALDAAAVNHLRVDVGSLTDAELAPPTRCAGWNVEDLIAHMTAEHDVILDPLAGLTKQSVSFGLLSDPI
jgi:hypothetical protein